MKRSRSGQSTRMFAGFAQLVRVSRSQVEPVDRLERLHLAQRGGRERRFAFEGVQHNALEQVAEGQVELGGERLQHLQQTGLQTHAGLGADDFLHWYHVTKVPMVPQISQRMWTAAVVPGQKHPPLQPPATCRRSSDTARI